MSMPKKKDVFYEQWVDQLPSCEGKVVAITGTTSGTGFWTAICAIRKNAKAVLLLNRTSSRSEEALLKFEEEKKKCSTNTNIIPIECDLMSFESVKKAAAEVNDIVKSLGGLNVLANNAGIMAFPDERTKDGYDVQIQVNHLSHFLLTKSLLPAFEMALDAEGEVRVVQHSSGARNMTGTNLEEKYFKPCAENSLGGNGLYQCFVRYHQTKLANTCFALKLHKELNAHQYNTSRFKSVVAEPGVAGTDLAENLVSAHKGKNPGLLFRVLSGLFGVISRMIPSQSPADGSLPLIQACFGAEVESGDFFYPEGLQVGKPYKGISKGEVVPKAKGGNEKLSLSEGNQNLLWKASEEAIGSSFFNNI